MADRHRFPEEHIQETLQRITQHCEQAAGSLDPDELEQLADLLLRVCGHDPEYPCRSELEHASLDIRSLDALWSQPGERSFQQAAPPERSTVVQQALVARLLVAAQLPSRKQREVARLRLWGYTLREIGEMLDVPLSTVISRWRCARRHLQRAMTEIPPSEWMQCPSSDPHVTSGQAQEAFREEQARRSYRHPRHCRPGRERCRVTGICPSAIDLPAGR